MAADEHTPAVTFVHGASSRARVLQQVLFGVLRRRAGRRGGAEGRRPAGRRRRGARASRSPSSRAGGRSRAGSSSVAPIARPTPTGGGAAAWLERNPPL